MFDSVSHVIYIYIDLGGLGHTAQVLSFFEGTLQLLARNPPKPVKNKIIEYCQDYWAQWHQNQDRETPIPYLVEATNHLLFLEEPFSVSQSVVRPSETLRPYRVVRAMWCMTAT